MLRFFMFVLCFVFSKPIFSSQSISFIQKKSQRSTIIVQDAQALSKNYLSLEGPWDFYSNRFIRPVEFYPRIVQEEEQQIFLPHFFEDETSFGTYHLRVEGLLPNGRYAANIYGKILSCCRIWCNRELVAIAGVVGEKKFSSTPGRNSNIIDLPADENGVLDIVVYAANFELERGGIVKKLSISEKTNIEKKYLSVLFFSVMVMAFLFALVIYNMILMFMNAKPFVYLSLVICCLCFIFSVTTSGISLFNLTFPKVPFWIEFRLSEFFLAMDICAYVFYMAASKRISARHSKILCVSSILILILCATVSLKNFERYRMFFVLGPLSILGAVLFLSVKLFFKKNLVTRKFATLNSLIYNFDIFVSFEILVAFFYDFIIFPQNILLVPSCIALKLGIFLFAFMQCTIPAFRRYFTNYRLIQSSTRFKVSNKSLSKFVPDQILKFMNAEDITKIIPGSCRIFDAIIFYVEIRYFKQLSESLGPKELFEVVAEYFEGVEQEIRAAGGCVAKFFRHGCLAIFSERSDVAIRCAMNIQTRQTEIRRTLQKRRGTDLSLGIAIHSGKVAWGIVGSEKRLDTIVISPDIQIAIELGAKTSKTDKKIFITEDAMNFCRSYTKCLYEGHFTHIGKNRILVYNAIAYNEFESVRENSLELAEELEDIGSLDEV